MSDSTTPSEGSWLRRERWTLLGVIALTALVATLASRLEIGGAEDPRPRAAIGEVVIGPWYDDEGITTTEVRLPWARMEANISAPLQEIPRLSDPEKAPLRPPADGSFIQVSIERADDFLIPLPSTAAPFVGKAEAVLTAGGRDYPITTAGFRLDAGAPVLDFGGTVWVAVDGQPRDAALSISVEGDTQVLADGKVSGGRAEDLSDVPTVEELGELRDRAPVKCGPPTRTAADGLTLEGVDYTRCSRKLAIRAPYVDGLGWAEPGRDFLVVHIAASTRSLYVQDDNDPDRWWNNHNDRLRVTLDGEPSLAEVDVNSLADGLTSITDPDDPQQFVFDVASDEAAGDLELIYTADMVPIDPFDGDTRQLEVRWQMPSGDPAGGSR